jgi:predicted 3-demethylubiquinone-9 3-methyltransferase (glyoxalase superfamily)
VNPITPCLWFDGQAEEAARFYVELFPDARIEHIQRAAADNPSTPEGAVLTVEFSLGEQRFMALDGGPEYRFSEAVSFVIDCADQAEVDRYWAALTADGGEPGPCGWCKDRFGLSWQVVPRRLNELLGGPDAAGARRAMEALLEMSKLDVAALELAYEGQPA